MKIVDKNLMNESVCLCIYKKKYYIYVCVYACQHMRGYGVEDDEGGIFVGA